jgi:hypothetical protein
MIEKLNSKKSKTGLVRTNERIKIRSGEESRIHKIKSIVYIKDYNSKTEDFQSRDIDWSHRWSVRGHWRKVDSIGKNRAGEYVISGWTWVTEHEKGPDEAPLITKTRIVKDSIEKRIE